MTRSLNTDATNLVTCPKCNQPPGKICRSPQNRKTESPHKERIRNWTSHPNYNQKDYELKFITFEDIVRCRINQVKK